MSGGEGFLARWSRRKAGVETEEERRVAAPAATSAPAAVERAPVAAAPNAASPDATLPDASAPKPTPTDPPLPLPTLADVAALTRDSDYTRFMLPGVDGAVRNAAMKKLFSDPHFNVMDGLDIYIDDYNKPDPLPLSMLRQLRQSEMLGLFREDPAADAQVAGAAATAGAIPDNAGAPVSATPPAPPTDDPARAEDDPSLRLQPDDADRRPGPGEGAGP